MPRNFIVFILLGLTAVSQAKADCPCTVGVPLDQSQITSLLNGNTVCAILGSERWQEWHSGGAVFELGNNAAGDNVGTWSTSPDATVTYSYGTGGSGGTYKYSVCQQGQNYDFCGATFGGKNVTNALVKPGKGGC